MVPAFGILTPILSITVSGVRSSFRWADYATLGVYLVATLGIGLYFSGREKTTRDFFLGGERVPWWAAGLSIFATQLSAITFMSIPAKAFDADWTYIIIHVTIVLVAPVAVFFYLPFFRRLKLTTAYQYLEKRFNAAVCVLGAIAYCLMQLARMGIVLFLPSLALSTVTDLNIYASILVMGVVCTVYTTFGGIEGVIWTDVVQAVVLLGGALLCVAIIALNVEGGFTGIIDIGIHNNKFNIVNFSWTWTSTSFWVVFVGNFFSNLAPYCADQTVIQRYLTTPTERQAARAIWTNAVMTIPAGLIFFFLGTALFAFYATRPQNLDPNLGSDAILPWFIVHELPSGLAGLVVAAIFAATMSTFDSILNSMATVLVTDLYQRLKPGSADSLRLLLAQIITVILGIFGIGCSLVMAIYPIKSMWDLFIVLLGLLGSGLVGIFTLGIFTRRANSFGAITGFVCSTVVLFSIRQYTQIHFFLYPAIGIVTCFSVGYLGSLFAKQSKWCSSDLTIYEFFKKK